MDLKLPERSKKVRRRDVIFLPAAAAGAAAVAAGSTGCASLLGEETIEAYVVVYNGGSENFYGWTEYYLDEPPDPDLGATLERVLLRAPEGVSDLRFITSLFAEIVSDTSRTPAAQGSDFPANDTMAALEILYDGDIAPLIKDETTIRIEWSGTIDTTFVFPEDGIRVDALIVIEVL